MRSQLNNGTAVSSKTPALSSSETFSEALEDVLDTTVSPSFAANEASCFKENMNVNKVEIPKLAMIPLQMKKKKRGGGFNLRKSLAWDRAFFTEEGVLDPQELSVISAASFREGISFANGQTAVDFPTKPTNIQEVKNNVFKDQCNEDLTQKDISSMRLDSSSSNLIASPSTVSHKVPTIVGCKKSGSGCSDIPRPLTSSSLKRPANLNVSRAAGKELKLLKVPGSKTDFSPISATTKRTIPRANNVKHNPINQPGSGLKSSCKSLKINQNASRSLQSVLSSDGNSDNSSYRRHSSINMSPLLLCKADNSGSHIITPARPEGQHELETSAALLSRNAHFNGGTMHSSQNLVLKPSGLRMPSPSLSFFSQPKPSVCRDLSLRSTGTGVCGFQRHGNSRLKETWRIPEVDEKIQLIAIHNEATSHRSVCPSSHVSAVPSITRIMEQAPMQKVQNCSKKKILEPHNESELRSIKNGVTSHSQGQEQETNYILLKSGIDCNPEKRELCKSDRKNPVVQAECRLSIQECKETLTVDELLETKDAHCEYTLNHRVQKYLISQSDEEDACKSDYHGHCSSDADNVKILLSETDEEKNSQKSIESGESELSQKSSDLCYQSRSVEALKCRTSKSEHSYIRSRDLCAGLFKESPVVVLSPDNSLAGCADALNAACNPNIRSKNNVSLILEVGDDSEQNGKGCVLQSSPEVGLELQTNVELNTNERLPEKKMCLDEQNIELLTFVSPDTIDPKAVSSSSLGKSHECNLDQEKSVGRIPSSTDSNSAGNSMSPLRHNNVTDNIFNSDGMHEGDTNYILNDPVYANLSNSLNIDSQRAEFNYFGLLPIGWTHENSKENTIRNIGDTGSFIQDGSTYNQQSLSASLREYEPNMHNLQNAKDWGTELVQPPESSALMKCCCELSEQLSSHVKFGVENCEHDNIRLHCENDVQRKSPANKHDKENELWSKENPIIELSNLHTSNFMRPAQEKSSELGSCNDESGHCVDSHIADLMTTPQRICPLSDSANSEASEDKSSIFPRLDADNMEAVLAPGNTSGDNPSEKSCVFVLPQNAVPFSDEWLAAIEAAGEDILTRKSGAVQNSPPDKPAPEPSPWSPVKKRNNQIGPFDCTKCTNNLPSDSN